MRSSVFIAALAAICAALFCPHADAQTDYPAKPVKIIVPYPPAGTTDILARLLATKLTERLKQSFVVENKAGAAGNLGTEQVARAAPDGYTLLMGTAGNMTLNPATHVSMPLDPVKDFQAISLVAEVPNLMVVHPSVPAKTVQEFVAWAKTKPKDVFFATTGAGNTPHMSGELFNLAIGTELVPVHYKGSGPALQDLTANQGVQVMWDNLPSVIGHVRSGALRPLAVTTVKRSPALGDTPTLAESGLAGYEVTAWFGVFAPTKTPRPIIDKLHQEIVTGMAEPDMQTKMSELGALPVLNTPEVFQKRVADEIGKWKGVAKQANVKVE